MPKNAKSLSDIGDERDQAVFMAVVKLSFNGDLQAALAEYNKRIENTQKILDQKKKPSSSVDPLAEIHINLPSQ